MFRRILLVSLKLTLVFGIYSPDSYYSYDRDHAYQYNLTDNYAEPSVYGPPRSIINTHSRGPLIEYGGFKPSFSPIFPSIPHFRGPTFPAGGYPSSSPAGPIPGQSSSTPPGFGAPETAPLGAGCSAPPLPCTNGKYRTLDGTCNNLKYPSWGAANTKYGRLVAPKYADGIHAPPTSVQGAELPLARLVSIVMFPDLPVPDPLWTLVTMSWGQIITHDMSMAVGTAQAKRHSTRCCDDDGRLFASSANNPLCFPIIIPDDDPVFSKYKRMCMNFVRSTTDIETGCNPGSAPAEQLVSVTHWMDASLVYGNNDQATGTLREHIGGRMKVEFKDHNRPFPPTTRNKTAVCDLPNEREPCYQFGDRRANQNPQLTVLQILLLREHNRLATVLSHVNPHWDDETLFQEARRILIAEYQHINYYEYLPIVLGMDNMLKYKLIYKTKGYTKDYNENVDPSVLNGHATAAFRYFHSAIQGHFQLIEEGRHVIDNVRLSDFFNRPIIVEQHLDHLTRGLSTQSQEEVDPFFTSEITDFLFRRDRPFGRDLRAIDIQRGRDHGLGSYNDYREFCGLPRAHKFEDFLDFIDPERIEKLSILYPHPDDVDFTVGGSLEAHAPGTLAGPTFLCILLEQFYRTRVADRYFYERGHQPGSFAPEQLKEIRKASLARIFCDNGDEIHTMQPSAFLKLSDANPLVSCDDYEKIPAIDLNLWKESPHQAYLYDDYKK